ncbi:hypothetical protein [Mycobacterium talmoniae]|uniref:hypothetical protein n=1 Tax=Mycobacterium talmoniae TaxID=1858794 RepID=UPI001058E262|nr:MULTISPECIES: hypothetical protein [Mycobacterium]TDH50199.1 hypothetical protein E2F47_18645 [Mycobacterium eburneum]
MNVSGWATELLQRHADAVASARIDDVHALVADGEGWLAAYDLFRDGMDDGWLTTTDLSEALGLARAGAFSKFSADVERKAARALANRGRIAL